MNSLLVKWSKGLITLAISSLSLYFFYQNKEEFYQIAKVSNTLFIFLLFFIIFSIILNGNKLRLISESFNIKLFLKEWLGLAFISSSFNGVVYKSGSLITSNYLKRKYNFPYTAFIGSLSADLFMLILINLFIGFLVSIYIVFSYPDIYPLTILFFLLGTALFYLIKNPFNTLRTDKGFFNGLNRIILTFNKTFHNKILFAKLFLNNFTIVFLTGLRLFFLCKAIGIEFEILHCYLYTTSWSFIRNMPILQSDIGSREFATGFLSEILGSGFREGVLATAFDRILEMAIALVGTILFSHIFFVPTHESTKT